MTGWDFAEIRTFVHMAPRILPNLMLYRAEAVEKFRVIHLQPLYFWKLSQGRPTLAINVNYHRRRTQSRIALTSQVAKNRPYTGGFFVFAAITQA